MVQQNIDKIISNYLTKNIVFSEENLLATKLSLLDTLGCIYNASTYEDPMRFATRGEYGSNTNPFLVINDMRSSKEITRYLSILRDGLITTIPFWRKSGHTHLIILVQHLVIFSTTKTKIYQNFFNP